MTVSVSDLSDPTKRREVGGSRATYGRTQLRAGTDHPVVIGLRSRALGKHGCCSEEVIGPRPDSLNFVQGHRYAGFPYTLFNMVPYSTTVTDCSRHPPLS